MPCVHPLTAWRGEWKDNGKREIIFDRSKCKKIQPEEIKLPCGQCVGCRLERSRQWAMRCVHEASLHKENMFLTLTYDKDHLPASQSLVLEDFQKFMKRYRRYANVPLRFFHCGEYGEITFRPHYHSCIFGHSFDDKILWATKNGNRLYTSRALNLLWGKGYCIIGDVTFDSAAYVARYIMKKITGEKAEEHYKGRKPEYVTMSRRPGIGKGWYDKWKEDIYPHDYVIINGKKVHPSKYYDAIYEKESPGSYLTMKENRLNKIKHEYEKYELLMGHIDLIVNNSEENLAAKEYVLKQKLKQNRREPENYLGGSL